MDSDAIEILMVEDNPGDVELTREALKAGKLHNHFNVVEDGEAALDYLFQRPPFEDALRPDLILLDLNLPKISGREVLAEVKADKGLCTIPIVVLSSSEDAADIKKAYELNANSFVTKPVQIESFIKVAQAIEHFWIKIVKLPSGKN
ncbi:MAG: response regulator [Cellvibrionaceae bacterium]